MVACPVETNFQLTSGTGLPQATGRLFGASGSIPLISYPNMHARRPYAMCHHDHTHPQYRRYTGKFERQSYSLALMIHQSTYSDPRAPAILNLRAEPQLRQLKVSSSILWQDGSDEGRMACPLCMLVVM